MLHYWTVYMWYVTNGVGLINCVGSGGCDMESMSLEQVEYWLSNMANWL